MSKRNRTNFNWYLSSIFFRSIRERKTTTTATTTTTSIKYRFSTCLFWL